MIKGFEPPRQTEPVGEDRLQWLPAIVAGLIAGVILLILPHGTPWSRLTLFSPTVMGRIVPASLAIPVFSVIVMHLGLSLIYGLIVSLMVINVRELRAVVIGGVVGLALYCLNFGIVSLWFPALKGNEIPVLVTHFVFGLIAAGAYRGLLRRRVAAAAPPA
ncbi:MAG TPA: hypothetical protein VKV04_13205 [Verrucomicrobiae bacterium]|nr:hypothetical protein [Verrucomicrobiae bacterium]